MPFSQIITALAIIVATGQLALAAPANSVDSHTQQQTATMQGRVNDLALQLELTYRQDRPLYRERYLRLAETLVAWNASARSDQDYQLMQEWIALALRNSMPDVRRAMPNTPSFNASAAVAALPEPASLPAVVEVEPAESTTQSSTQVVAIEVPESPEPVVTSEPIAAKPERSKSETPTARHSTPQPQSSAVERSQTASQQIVPSLKEEANPFQDDPVPHIASVQSEPRQARTTLRVISPPVESIGIDLAELAARIEGQRLAVKRLDVALSDARSISTVELMRHAQELEVLVEQQEFLQLYFANLTQAETRELPTRVELRPTVRLARQAIEARLASSEGSAELRRQSRQLKELESAL